MASEKMETDEATKKQEDALLDDPNDAAILQAACRLTQPVANEHRGGQQVWLSLAVAKTVPPPPPPSRPPHQLTQGPATAHGGYTTKRHQRSGQKVRARQQQWATLQAVRAQAVSLKSQAATLRDIVSIQCRGRGRGDYGGRRDRGGRGDRRVII